jgi:hypothetical protein
MSMKSCEIGTQAWARSTGTSREAFCSSTRSRTTNSWLDQTKRRRQHASCEKRNQGLLHDSFQFQVPITRGWVNSFVFRDQDEMSQAKSSRQEEQRLHPP